jgi:uncharacterized integral membrane protein (TIGR00697 family)
VSQTIAPGCDTLDDVARSFRYLDALTVSFVLILLISNLLAQKIIRFGPIHLFGPVTIPVISTSGVIILFPVMYIFGDIFTEIYGYAASRRAIWLGFGSTGLLYGLVAIILALPSDPSFKHQNALVAVFGILPRIFISSLIAYWAGEFANSYTMAKLKLLTRGRWLWTRTVGSTIIGQFVDTVLVVVLMFAGSYSTRTLITVICADYAMKVLYEVFATPLTYAVIGWLKRAEGVDAFDAHTDFNPFRFSSKTLG